ncbi:Ubiquitin carboxyl-terminal hydrolase [Penicillium ucsense]|uniref:Ubiquitin carboxyl-terminal hydrolase n=1 Tax=Penicillium ucsense TaxID=2839758 RepID=A0A8J8WLX9_9EURO|nr:Ubiquitin carboxyl-terminal hydrolase [Penicillium ucsense]KAF7735424.1 Ubiquitin carboxyl-terminal hydrolase [Penicillium ucsense]
MDASQADSTSPLTSIPSAAGDLQAQGSTAIPSRQSVSDLTPTTPQTDTVPPVSPTETPSETVHAPRLPSSTSVEPDELVEHAYWAEIAEDRSGPDEEELKEINSAEQDYSACDHTYWESNFFRDLNDPEYVPREKMRLTWTLKGVRGTREAPNRAKVMRSPAAFVGGYWWRIKFYPRGNNVGSLSVYLECSPTMPDPDETLPDTSFTVRRGKAETKLDDVVPEFDIQTPATSDSRMWLNDFRAKYYQAAPDARAVETDAEAHSSGPWRVAAQIGVIVYNPEEPRTGWMQSSCHQFNPHNLDWGWTYFHGPWDQIHKRRRGQHRALLNNDTLAFDAYIRVIDDPTQSLWWHPSDSEPTWDSLALTGYRPLGDSVINHSAEVAGLASWLHIAPFCKIIEGVNVLEHLTNGDVKPKPLCDALQKLLWQLRRPSKSHQYVDTDGITSTLRNLREFSSDVSEFWERLRRTLEIELAGTEAGREFAQLFDSPAQDVDVNRLPAAYNSRLCVRADQAQSTGQAVKEYLAAKPGQWSLPPVLHVELGRHVLDKSMRWQLAFNRVELDEELDLAPYVIDGQGSKYVLYGYVVHRGRRTSGKFFSILRPAGPGSKWLAFDDGSDNRVECLTQKTALGPHLGLKASELVDHKKGHDVPVNVMYVRSDMVQDLLPGPRGPWQVSEPLKQYLETGVYEAPRDATDRNVHVEVYSSTGYEKLSSLFDGYDLMKQAKESNSVMYMTLPRHSRLVELRQKISTWKFSRESNVRPELVRLWHLGQTRAHCGSTLALDLITDLNAPLDPFETTMRFWMETISEDDAKVFGIPDPQPVIVGGDKAEESIVERFGLNTPELSSSNSDGEAVASSSGYIGSRTLPTHAGLSNTSDGNAPESESQIAIAAAEVDAATTGPAPVVTVANAADQRSSSPTHRSASTSLPQMESLQDPAPSSPAGHAYYFIQIFDPDNQVLRTVGSFFSKLDANVKASIRKHMKWTIRRDFLLWKRVDGTTVTSVSPAETFGDAMLAHGSCIIIGDKITKEKRSQLSLDGLFSSPDRLVHYLWAESRHHPLAGFTGHQTLEATFVNDFYSGEILKGYYHGRGKHISATGTVYEGDFIFSRRHGQGKMEYPTGDTYDGDWVDDVRHGQGTYIEKSTGNKYVGGYKDGKRHGKGISYWEVADDEADLCQICYSEEQNAVFCDCGHICSCVTCAKQVDLCPICRKTIKNVIKIYRT